VTWCSSMALQCLQAAQSRASRNAQPEICTRHFSWYAERDGVRFAGLAFPIETVASTDVTFQMLTAV
jgi:hypothetical protein